MHPFDILRLHPYVVALDADFVAKLVKQLGGLRCYICDDYLRTLQPTLRNSGSVALGCVGIYCSIRHQQMFLANSLSAGPKASVMSASNITFKSPPSLAGTTGKLAAPYLQP